MNEEKGLVGRMLPYGLIVGGGLGLVLGANLTMEVGNALDLMSNSLNESSVRTIVNSTYWPSVVKNFAGYVVTLASGASLGAGIVKYSQNKDGQDSNVSKDRNSKEAWLNLNSYVPKKN